MQVKLEVKVILLFENLLLLLDLTDVFAIFEDLGNLYAIFNIALFPEFINLEMDFEPEKLLFSELFITFVAEIDGFGCSV